MPRPAERLLIDDGRYLIALSLMVDDPVALVAAWPHDVHRLGDAAYAAYRARFPDIATKTRIAGSAESLSIEQILDVAPDVAIFRAGMGPTPEQVRQIEAAGIQVVFIDFFSQPLENLAPSLAILGQLVGAQQRARAFIDFRAEHLARITDRVKSTPDLARPRVFLEVHAGLTECCNAPGRGNIGNYVELAGGHNIAADVLPGAVGKLGIEFIIDSEPEIYIATGGPQTAKAGGFVIGPQFGIEETRASLARMAARPGIASLAPVERGEVHGLAHQLLNSPLDILVAERLAKWIHPDLFADVDPDATLAELNARFLAVPLAGPNWIDLR
ncbi:ABC transporter substrate-binding protein [Pseudochelatococcus sp. B33]